MSQIGRFDCSAGNAYVTKTLPAADGYTIEFELLVPQRTFNAVAAMSGALADLLVLGGVGGLFGHTSPPTFSTDDGGGFAATPALTPGRWTSGKAALTYTGSGTDWTVGWTVDSTDLFAPYPVTYPGDNTAPFEMQLGGVFSTSVAGQVYYFRNVVVRDNLGVVIFSPTFDDFSDWDGGAPTGDATVVTEGFFVKIFDLGTTELADITAICREPSLEVDLEQCGPWQFTFTSPAGHELLTTIADDGYPNLRRDIRKLYVEENGEPLFHGRIKIVDRVGDGTENLVKVTAFNPYLTECGFDGDDRAGRIVRGSTVQPTAGDPYGNYDGNFISPKFASSVADQDGISGPDLVKQVLTNSQNVGTESDPAPGEGPLPIDLTSGTFDLDVPPAVDLSVLDTMDWPGMVGDFINQLIESGVCDVYMRPIKPGTGINLNGDPDPFIMVELSAVSKYGSDLSAAVHFDYWTGIFNAAAAEHLESGETLCNKLYDYLAPRIDQNHWKGSITPGSLGVTVDPTSSRALYGGPGDNPGEFMQIRVFDSVGDENDSRPLYMALFNAELGYRMEPRDLLYITPQVGSKAVFDAMHDYKAGDEITQNVGVALGVEIAAKQRIFGFTKSWDRQFVASVSKLMTTADVDLSGGG